MKTISFFSLYSPLRLFVTACCVMACTLVSAIPADPTPKVITLADGSTMTVMMRGDEHGHALFTTDGTPLVYDSTTGMYVATTLQDAWRQGMPRHEAKSAARRLKTDDGYQHPLINDFPTIGHQKTLVILIEFSDVQFSSVDDPHQFYTDMLNQEGFTYSNGANGSARDFYHDASANVFDPEFVVVGPIKLPKKATYYGTDIGGQDHNMGEAVNDACILAHDSLGVDFSQFDANNDGVVDNVAVLYAGYGQADHPNGSEFIWPHAADLDEAWGIILDLDGKRVGHYFCSNELRYYADGRLVPTGIGTVVHEFGHILGLPDLYNVAYSLLDVGLNYWDTMASGSYNNNMNTPPTFSAYERMVLGWLEPEVLDMGADSLLSLPHVLDSNKAYYVPVPGKPYEFYMLENRQQVSWDEYIYGHGMLLWHIDEDAELWANNTVNVEYYHHHVDIEPADGVRSDASRSGDAMPGADKVTNYTMLSWDKDELLTVDGLTEQDGLIQFLVQGSAYVLPAPAGVSVTGVRDSSFTFTWTDVPQAVGYKVSVSQSVDGAWQPLDGYDGLTFDAVSDVSVLGLSPFTQYQVTVQALRGTFASDITQQVVTTLKLDFDKRTPGNLTVRDVAGDAFTAVWSGVEDATDYQVTLYRHDYSDTQDTKGYGFDQKAEGMPPLWASSSSTFYSVSGYYGASAPSLRFSKNDDFLEVAFDESKIDAVSFWVRSKNADGLLHVERLDNGQWVNVASFQPSTDGTTVSYGTNGTDRVRIRYERVSGFVVIDDVVATCTSVARTPVDGYDAVSTGGAAQYRFDGLSAGHYSFRVVALDGDVRSRVSDEYALDLTGQQGPEESITLGYCNGDIAATGLGQTGSGWVQAAVKVPAASLTAYAGNRISEIRAAMVARVNIDTLRVWVRSSLDGPDLAQGVMTRYDEVKIAKGWNEVALDDPLYLTASTGDLYIGYSYHHKASVNAVSVVGEPVQDMTFLKLGDDAWQDISSQGTLSIEAVIRGSSILSYDLGIDAVQISPDPSRGEHSLRVKATVHNYGKLSPSVADFRCSAPGIGDFDVRVPVDIAPTTSGVVSFNIDPQVATDDTTPWTVSVIGLGDNADQNAANNSARADYTFLRNALVEEFTTEQCVNCPRVAGYLHQALTSDAEFNERAFAVCHHSGYYTDWLTQDCDNDMLWLYNAGNSTYAPAMMFNRRPLGTAANGATPVVLPSSADEIAQQIYYEMSTTANAVVGVQLDCNSDSTVITATVLCQRNAKLSIDDPRLTLYLTEDNIKARNQIGADGVYMQQHVIRAYNSTWGEPVVWDENKFTYTYQFQVAKDWKLSDLRVVALLANYDADDPANCMVQNSAATALVDPATLDVRTIQTAPATAATYDITGRRTNSAAKGIQIVRMTDGRTIKRINR